MKVWDSIGALRLGDVLEERSGQHPGREWLVYESSAGNICRFTYAEFNARVNQVANGLARRGIGRGTPVVVHMGNCPALLLTWFALSKLGALFVPTNALYTAEEMVYILRFAEPAAIVTDPQRWPVIAEATADAAMDIPTFITGDAPVKSGGAYSWDELWAGEKESFERIAFSNEETAEVLFTSGSTAQPKGVELTHANLHWAGEHVAKCTRLGPTDRNFTPLPLFHVNAQSTVLSTLTVGATLVLLESYSATKYWSQVRAHGATSIHLISALLRTIAAQPPLPTDRDNKVRWVSYSLNCTDEEKASFEERFNVQLSNGYGLTEACVCVSLAPLDAPRRWPSVGVPAFGRTVRIIDEQGNDVAQGVTGEIIVHGFPGRTIFKGYYKDPEATRATVVDGWLHTGDQGYLDEAGYLYFFDRIKDVIKRGGENISASEVERAIAQHPDVLECAVIGVRDPIKDESVKAFVVARPGAALSEQDVVAFCTTRLSRFKVPQIVEIRSELPKTPIGKIAKKLLRQP
jgi:crotonobetaine/carnitine-CoA ligase